MTTSALDNFQLQFEELKKPKYIKRTGLTQAQIKRLNVDKCIEQLINSLNPQPSKLN